MNRSEARTFKRTPYPSYRHREKIHRATHILHFIKTNKKSAMSLSVGKISQPREVQYWPTSDMIRKRIQEFVKRLQIYFHDCFDFLETLVSPTRRPEAFSVTLLHMKEKKS